MDRFICTVELRYTVSLQNQERLIEITPFSRQKGAIYGASETSHIHICIYVCMFIYV